MTWPEPFLSVLKTRQRVENEPICQASVNAMLELRFPHSGNVIGRQFTDDYVNYVLSAKQAQKATDSLYLYVWVKGASSD